MQVVGLYRDFDLGIFWWVCDLVLGGRFVIWFWMGVVCGGFAGGGDYGGFFFFFFFSVVGGGEWRWRWRWRFLFAVIFFFFFC